MGPVPGDLGLHPDPDPDASVDTLVQRLTYRRFSVSHPDPVQAREAARARIAGMAGLRLYWVLEGGRRGAERGHVWLFEQPGGEDVGVADLTLDDHRIAWQVRDLVTDLARAEGFRRLTVSVSPADPVLEEFERGGGFSLTASHLALDLAHRLPDAGGLVLEPMTQAAYDAWEAVEIEAYALERQAAGDSPEAALTRSRQEHEELLPRGLATPGHHFLHGRAGGEVVSHVWLCTRDPMTFVYDLAVDPAHRGARHGAATMTAAAVWAQQRGAHAIGLNVFGHNTVARAMYDRLGYHVTERFMALVL